MMQMMNFGISLFRFITAYFFGANSVKQKDTLNIFYSYQRSSGYGTIQKKKKTTLERFILSAKDNNSNYRYGFINTEFNGINYPVHDLDSEDQYLLFLSEMEKLGKKYVIFRSSKSGPDNSLTVGSGSYKETRRYWGIIDEEIKDIKNYSDVNWHIINDTEYVKCSKEDNEFCVRFLYENENRKPVRIKSSDNVSENFKKFIFKFEELIENEGLVISALVSKDSNLLKRYNRLKKIERIVEED